MTQFENHNVSAQTFLQADSIVYNLGSPPVEYRSRAEAALASHRYAEAVHGFRRALHSEPGNAELHYRLALSLLDGKRPNRLTRELLSEVKSHLADASELPEAQALLLLVSEDRGLSWRRFDLLTDDVRERLNKVDIVRVDEIVEHVPAPEARVWTALRARLGGA